MTDLLTHCQHNLRIYSVECHVFRQVHLLSATGMLIVVMVLVLVIAVVVEGPGVLLMQD
jgi:hypothetical protein